MDAITPTAPKKAALFFERNMYGGYEGYVKYMDGNGRICGNSVTPERYLELLAQKALTDPLPERYPSEEEVRKFIEWLEFKRASEHKSDF